jgi:hypothetical protein
MLDDNLGLLQAVEDFDVQARAPKKVAACRDNHRVAKGTDRIVRGLKRFAPQSEILIE